MPKTLETPKALYCSFCSKNQHEVTLLVAGPKPALFVCDECIDLLALIIADRKPRSEGTMDRDSPNPGQLYALWKHCRAFIEKQHISCSETVHQTDHVIENAYDFIDGVCQIAGFDEAS